MYHAFYGEEARQLAGWALGDEPNRIRASKMMKIAQRMESLCRDHKSPNGIMVFPLPPQSHSWDNDKIQNSYVCPW